MADYSKHKYAMFLSEATGRSYENALSELNTKGKEAFSKTLFANFLSKETGCSFENALMNQNMIKPTKFK